jgi:hypothetical protein
MVVRRGDDDDDDGDGYDHDDEREVKDLNNAQDTL